MDVDFAEGDEPSTQNVHPNHVAFSPTVNVPLRHSPSRTVVFESPDKTFRTAKEEQTTRILANVELDAQVSTQEQVEDDDENDGLVSSPQPTGASQTNPSPAKAQDDSNSEAHGAVEQAEAHENGTPSGDARSPSEGSSPMRPFPRKSSLNFASLPAREPLTAGKSIGARVSRTSQLDHNRTSYYGRPTGGKSLNYAKRDVSDVEDHDEIDVDEDESAPAQKSQDAETIAENHNKTYTQRLQDSINMLGMSQPHGSRPSKSIQNLAAASQTKATVPPVAQEPKSPSPRKIETATTPGAFPEDDDDDWIDPPSIGPVRPAALPARPSLLKSHTADVMEGISSKDTVGGAEFGQAVSQKASQSPLRPTESDKPQRPSILGHTKSASVSAIPTVGSSHVREGSPLKKAISVSNPSLAMEMGSEASHTKTPSKSPSRSFRDGPLKQMKSTLSSILKSSKGLLASSAALSAEGKSSILSPSTTRLGVFPGPSTESVVTNSTTEPFKTQQITSTAEREGSPTRPIARRTRASVEREKEEKRREKEAKRLADQMDKLDKAREKEREKARVFSKEQEKIALMEKQMASKKEADRLASSETSRPTRSSPRKAKVQEDAVPTTANEDVEMEDAASAMPPPSVPRSAGAAQSLRNKELKRPLKPAREVQSKAKQAPTVIRVNTGSQHSQFHPSSSYQDHASSTSSQTQLASKSSKPALQSKPSLQSLKSSLSSNGRPKALDLAAKRKEQEERDAQRRREAKAELERKRAAAQEEQRRQEQQRRQELERQRQKEREQAEAKKNAQREAALEKNAQRQAAIEKAKQTRAPPPAVRSQPTGPPDYNVAQSQRTDGPPTRPPSRMNSGIYRSQEDAGRPINAVLSNASKSLAKRPLGQDAHEDPQSRPAPTRGGPAYQAQDAKRRRTSDDFGDEPETNNLPNIKGPPVRPSGGIKKVSKRYLKMKSKR